VKTQLQTYTKLYVFFQFSATQGPHNVLNITLSPFLPSVTARFFSHSRMPIYVTSWTASLRYRTRIARA